MWALEVIIAKNKKKESVSPLSCVRCGGSLPKKEPKDCSGRPHKKVKCCSANNKKYQEQQL